MERLLARIEMVELQSGLAARIPAQDAAPARLRDQLALDSAPVLGDARAATPRASVPPAALEHVWGGAMVPAHQLHVAQTGVRGLHGEAAVCGGARPKALAPELAAHDPRGAPSAVGDLWDGEAFRHQYGEQVGIDRLRRSIAVGAVGS
ncbi:MAG: hypothetical protein WKF94_05845 [Solirubrobacteraceae bacterium]